MKFYTYALVFLILFSCSPQEEPSTMPSGRELLTKSNAVHDPTNQWDKTILHLHIQEPRLSNPARYSKVQLNNANGAFELLRNRGEHESKHLLDEDGNATTYLDGEEEIEAALVEKFRLDPKRNQGYRQFYQMMYGLPMSLNAEVIDSMGSVEMANFNNETCYKIAIVLKEAMFSKNWQIYIGKDSYEFKGMDIVFPEDRTKGEKLYFDGSIDIGGMRIPRFRHWHEYSNNAYSGSDIIVKELE